MAENIEAEVLISSIEAMSQPTFQQSSLVVVVMDLLHLLDLRQRGCQRRNSTCDNLRANAAEIALRNLECHYEDEYSCDGFEFVEESSGSCPPYMSRFSPVHGLEHVLAVASEEGNITLVNTLKRGRNAILSHLKAHQNVIFDIKWMSDVPILFTASGDSSTSMWDVSTNQKISTFVGHSGSVKSIDIKPKDQAVFATGSRDGSIGIWDTRQNHRSGDNAHLDNLLKNVHQIVKTSQSAKVKRHQMETCQSVNVVLFQDDNNLFSAGVDECIKVWDLRKSYSACKTNPLPKFVFPYLGKSVKNIGYTSLSLNTSGTRLFASCTDSTIYEFNCASYDIQPVASYQGHQNSSYYVKSSLSPDNKFLLSGSNDKCAYIWKIGGPRYPLLSLIGHKEEVTAVDWCRVDHYKIVTCSDDTTFRIWRLLQYETGDDLVCGQVVKIGEKMCNGSDAEVKSGISPACLHNHASKFLSPKRTWRSSSTSLCEIQNLPVVINSYSSPTENLPNIVIDNMTTPIQKSSKSASKMHSKKWNWLTKYAANISQNNIYTSSSLSKRSKLSKKRHSKIKIGRRLEDYFT